MISTPRLRFVSAPVVSDVVDGSPAGLAGIKVGDTILSINGRVPLDVIEYQQLIDGERVDLVVARPGRPLSTKVVIEKALGEPMGMRVDSAVFDRIRTCDNHCEFCFIYQLPKGLRKSLYLKDDDYRLSFLYGNFTTLTRFTELDAERVITERLSPLYVSIHTTNPELRAEMLRNRRGSTSLQWLGVLLDAGIEIHGQLVVCPGVNDGVELESTLLDILDCYPKLASVGIVPLGISDHSSEPGLNAHSVSEARAVLDIVERLGNVAATTIGRRLFYASDEYYLVAERPLPESSYYDFTQVENGIGMVRAFRDEFFGLRERGAGSTGFFQAVDGAPPWGYRAVRTTNESARRNEQPILLTGAYGVGILRALLDELDMHHIEILEVRNDFFGGNIKVAGLMVGADIARTIESHGGMGRYVLPDVCLNEDRFLDGLRVEDLPGWVEVIETSGRALRTLLEAAPAPLGVTS